MRYPVFSYKRITRGYYNFEWDANKFSSGVYFIQLRTGEKQEMQKIVLMK